ncbi:electron transporter [Reichenbachiella sp. 5M10]|nr:electron transporter [Reichenbachiella sp. 5M10]
MVGLLVIGAGCKSSPSEKESRIEVLPYYNEATFTPQWYASDLDLPIGFHQIPSFRLVNQYGEEVTEHTVRGKISVVDFFFTSCPGICPKMASNMALVQEAFLETDEVIMLSLSVTPEYDSVPILRGYAERTEVVSGKWHLLTGDREEIYDLGRHWYFVEEDLGLQKAEEDFIHTENFILVDGNQHIRGIYNGLNKASVNQLIADIHTLQNQIE